MKIPKPKVFISALLLFFIALGFIVFLPKETQLPEQCVIPYYFDSYGYMYIQTDDFKRFILDTGAETSILFKENTNVSSSFQRFNKINKKEIAFVKTVDLLEIGELSIRNHPFAFLSITQTFHYPNEYLAGIIGMDILSQRFFFFDREKQLIYISKEKPSSLKAFPDLTLFYKEKTKPLITVSINEQIIDNILLDTGYNIFLALKHSDFIPGKKNKGKKKKKNTSFFNDKYDVLEAYYDTISVNDIIYSGSRYNRIPVIFNEELRILGNNFFSTWPSFYINPEDQSFGFYSKRYFPSN